MKEKRSKPISLRYIRNLLLAALVGLLASFYIILPIAQANQSVHPTRQEICCVTPADLGLDYEEVSFETADHITLSGWYVSSKNRAAIIMVHGAGGNRMGELRHAEILARRGYGVLLFDLRAHGNSEGEVFEFGWSTEDISAAIKYVEKRPDVDKDKIGGLGLSAGGQVLLQAATENEQLRAVVSDGAGAHTLRDALVIRSWYLAPGVWVFYRASEVLSGTPSPTSLRETLRLISPRSVMLISAEHGSFGEIAANKIYFDAAREPKILWEMSGVRHTTGLLEKPKEYEAIIVEFFDSVLVEKQ
jgi:dienelactone hydrolase